MIGGLIAVPVFLSPERHRAEITDGLTKFFKRPVVIGQLSMGYFPPTLQLGQLSVMKEAGTPILQVETTSVPLDWGALFHFKFAPAQLLLTHWKLIVLRKPDGSWDLLDWFSGLSGAQGTSPWRVTQVRWKAGEIDWTDPYAPAPQDLTLSSVDGHWTPKDGALNTTGTFSGLGSPAQLTFTAKGQFFSMPQWSGDLVMSDQDKTGTFHLDTKAGAFEVRGGSPRWPLANLLAFLKFYGRAAAGPAETSEALMLDNWQMHMSGTAAHFSFEHNAVISGGASEAKGILETTSAGIAAHVDWAVQEIPVQAIFNLTGEDIPLDGKLTALSKGMDLTLSTHTLSTVQGQGYWEVKDGHYKVPAVSLQKLAKAKTMAYLHAKFPDLEQNGLPVIKLSAHWSAKAGQVSIDDGIFQSTDMRAAWVGTLDTAHQGLDGYLRLQIQEKNPRLSHLIPPTYRGQPAYGHLQGTWQEWYLRSVRPYKIPSAIQTKLRRAK